MGSSKRVVIACGVIKPELEALRGADCNVEIRYMEQTLHRTPQAMTGVLQKEIDRATIHASQVVLGYGLCSNGTVGLAAPAGGLVVPRVHDCISLFLGSRGEYEEAFRQKPGAYYLTPGWIQQKKDPIGVMENDYEPRVGRDSAVWAMREELKHYTHVILIDTKAHDMAALRKRAQQNARFFDLEYEEVTGKRDYFEKILFGPYRPEDFLVLQPGERVNQESFF